MWKKIALLFLLFVTSLCSLPYLFKIINPIYRINSTEIIKYIHEDVPDEKNINSYISSILKQLPDIEVKNQQIKLIGLDEVNIFSPSNNELIAYINTSGNLVTTQSNSKILEITTDQIKFLKYKFNNNFKDIFSKDMNFIINKELFIEKIPSIAKIFMFIIILVGFPALIAISFITNILSALFFSAFAYAYIKIRKIKISFEAIFRIMCTALIPSIILSSFFYFFNLNELQYSNIILSVLQLINIIYPVWAISICTNFAIENKLVLNHIDQL